MYTATRHLYLTQISFLHEKTSDILNNASVNLSELKLANCNGWKEYLHVLFFLRQFYSKKKSNFTHSISMSEKCIFCRKGTL